MSAVTTTKMLKMSLLIPLQMREKLQLFQTLCLKNGVKKIFQLIISSSTKKKRKKKIENTFIYRLEHTSPFWIIFWRWSGKTCLWVIQRYAASKSIRAFLGILLISGYTCLRRHRMYWQKEVDVFNCAIADLLFRNHF